MTSRPTNETLETIRLDDETEVTQWLPMTQIVPPVFEWGGPRGATEFWTDPETEIQWWRGVRPASIADKIQRINE